MKPKVYLYLLKPKTEPYRHEMYRSVVVAARSPDEAKNIHPSGGSGGKITNAEWWRHGRESSFPVWVKTPDDVTVKCIGTAARGIEVGEIICADFLGA